MARLDHIKKRLEAWARWALAGTSGGLGFPRAAAFTRLTPRSLSPSSFTPDDEAMQTEHAVAALLPHHIDLWHTLQCYYVKQYDIARCAKALCVAESSVKARLCRADGVLEAWFIAQAELKENARQNKTP